jgi:hypothetical protein
VKEIPLSRGMVALVDDEDFGRVSAFKWCAKEGRHTFYGIRNTRRNDGGRTMQPLHRFILGLTDPKRQTDHINGNGLDNRRANLRDCTVAQNMANRGPASHNTSGIKGVYWFPQGKRWSAQIKANGVSKFLGYFHTKAEAAEVYAKAARELHGEFANTDGICDSVRIHQQQVIHRLTSGWEDSE